MKKRYYLDTSIWMDIYEDRIGYNGEPLGDYGLKLLLKIRSEGDALVISDIVMKELYSRTKIIIANRRNNRTFCLRFAILANPRP